MTGADPWQTDGGPAGGEGDIDAGPFGPWLAAVRMVRRAGGTSDVPCGSCTACCTSSQFVHVEPDEHGALAHIPPELLFPAPGRPRGHRLFGYDEHGHCPMLRDGACSIYDHRPRACRAYDCRVFAAAAVTPDAPAIAAQARRWRFAVTDGADVRSLVAVRVRAAASDVPSALGRALFAVDPPAGAAGGD